MDEYSERSLSSHTHVHSYRQILLRCHNWDEMFDSIAARTSAYISRILVKAQVSDRPLQLGLPLYMLIKGSPVAARLTYIDVTKNVSIEVQLNVFFFFSSFLKRSKWPQWLLRRSPTPQLRNRDTHESQNQISTILVTNISASYYILRKLVPMQSVQLVSSIAYYLLLPTSHRYYNSQMHLCVCVCMCV